MANKSMNRLSSSLGNYISKPLVNFLPTNIALIKKTDNNNVNKDSEIVT
jgi:hypothetical protein